MVNRIPYRKMLLLLLTLIISCNQGDIDKRKNNEDKNSLVYVYYDITEGLSNKTKHEYLQSIDDICKLMDINPKEEYGGAGYGEIHISFLNYEYFEKPLLLSVERRDKSETSFYYQKIIGNFITSLKDTLGYILNKPLTKLDTTSSVIIKHIFDGLGELEESHYKTKVMIIFSDMVEHNPQAGISFISGGLSEKNFDSTIKSIENIYKIKIPKPEELSDVSIFIIRPDHERYRKQRLIVEEFWKYVFGKNCKYQSIFNSTI